MTSVGGTAGSGPEIAWDGSSGGFSNYYKRPSYQNGAVTRYLAQHGKINAGRYNASGRGFPDIAAKADDFAILEPDRFVVSGTSAASPTVASIIALLNDMLLSKGKKPLGFLNPWLYSKATGAFTDITKGNSTVHCTENDVARGFTAQVGWDPVRSHISVSLSQPFLNERDGVYIGDGPWIAPLRQAGLPPRALRTLAAFASPSDYGTSSTLFK